MSQLQRTRRLVPVRNSIPRGFTLVEMLVSVTLVLMMMIMFASIFSMATDSVGKQRGISTLDQRARGLVTMMRSDLQHRTFRYPMPFFPGENSATSPTQFGNRAGYLYISTNDPYSGLDDLLQFTVNSDVLIENTDDTPYYAKAQMLSDRTLTTATSISVNPNQPEADDGSLLFNGTGSSNAAEVSYFVRNGNLYRRVQMLRKPLPIAGKELDDQPVTSRGYELMSGLDNNGNYDGQFWFDVNNNGTVDADETSDDFWRYFDYSAVPQNYGGNQNARFMGSGALSNELVGAGAAVESLGNPRFRFGFNHAGIGTIQNLFGNAVPAMGLSREHTEVGGFFIGRFTQAETSSTNFNWPHRPSNLTDTPGTVLWSGNDAPGNPMDIRNAVTFNGLTGVVDQFSEPTLGNGRGGPRRMEDLLLSDVHEMKVELWDERLQKYTTPGHSESVQVWDASNAQMVTVLGDYHESRRYVDADGYGPQGTSVGVFDTWHPNVDRNSNSVPEHPPHIAYRYTPPLLPSGPTRAVAGLLNEPDRTTHRQDNKGYWVKNNPNYEVGDVVFVPWSDADNDNQFQYNEMSEPKFTIAYRCVFVKNPGSSTSGNSPPPFPTAPGRRTRELNDEIEWESFDNRRPLNSIRITLRFMDAQSDTQRQLSLVIPLTDKK